VGAGESRTRRTSSPRDAWGEEEDVGGHLDRQGVLGGGLKRGGVALSCI